LRDNPEDGKCHDSNTLHGCIGHTMDAKLGQP
jgi:hypothetical protein